jgi:hypothetical protein
MNTRKFALAIAFSALVLTSSAFAGTKIALMPLAPTVSITGNQHPSTMELEAFCNGTPCNITWQQVQSNSNVGTLDKCTTCADTTTGPISHFTAGTATGAVIVTVDDGQGHMHTTVVNVVP